MVGALVSDVDVWRALEYQQTALEQMARTMAEYHEYCTQLNEVIVQQGVLIRDLEERIDRLERGV